MQGRNSVLRDFQRFMLKSLTQEINVMENASRPPQEACTYYISRASFTGLAASSLLPNWQNLFYPNLLFLGEK